MQYLPSTLVMSDLLDLYRTLNNSKLYNRIGFILDHTDNFIYFDSCKESISKIHKYNSKQI